jgi:hypothetical protein
VVRLVFIALIFAVSALCSDWSSLYDAAKLESQRPRLQQDLNTVIAQEIRPFLTLEQAHAFFKIGLDIPVQTGPDPNPLDFYSPKEGHIVVPLMTVAFVEDLSQAYSWLWANHFSSRTVDEYLGMLRQHAPGDFQNHQYPNPLVALHIPADAMNDPAVAQMAQRVRGTTLAFILLHQFGHLSYVTSAEEAALKHDRIDGDEERADLVALEVMKKNSETPAGLLMLIHGMMYLPSSAPKDHPLTEARLKAMADYLDARVREFSDGRPDRQLARIAIQSLASHLRQAARFLDDGTGQQLWAEQGRKTTIADLTPRHLAEPR